jgi:hypothetical protein
MSAYRARHGSAHIAQVMAAVLGCGSLIACSETGEPENVPTVAPFSVLGFRVDTPLAQYAEFGTPEVQEDGRLWLAWTGNRLVVGDSLYFPTANLISVHLWGRGDRVGDAFLRVGFTGLGEDLGDEFALACNGKLSAFVTWLSADLGSPENVFWGTTQAGPKASWRNAESKVIVNGDSIPEIPICVAEIFLSDGSSLLDLAPQRVAQPTG